MNFKNSNATCSCGFKKTINTEKLNISEMQKKPKEKAKGVIEDKNELATFPHQCPKCGYEKAQVIEMGIWFSDEAGVIRYKCGKCGFTEQDKGSNT